MTHRYIIHYINQDNHANSVIIRAENAYDARHIAYSVRNDIYEITNILQL